MIDDLSQAFELAFKGKVRDIYVLDNDKLLIYTSDRISAFDFTFDDPVIDKGIVLTKMAKFWFDKTKHIVKNHLCETPLDLSSKLEERCMVVTKTKVVPIEAIVRGHLAKCPLTIASIGTTFVFVTTIHLSSSFEDRSRGVSHK